MKRRPIGVRPPSWVRLPEGTTSYTPADARRKAHVESSLRQVFEGWGYGQAITPTFDFAEQLGVGLGAELRESMMRLSDGSGRALALRVDLTTPVARLVATRMREAPLPIRLYYIENVFRMEEVHRGRRREFWQAGVELFGGAGAGADAEVLILAAESLQSLGLREFQINLGHLGLIRAILDHMGIDGTERTWVLEAIDRKDETALAAALRAARAPARHAASLRRLVGLVGRHEALKAARPLRTLPGAREALARLEELWGWIADAGLERHVALDFGEVRGMDYYTGVNFEIFAPGVGAALGAGGRYDRLLAHYDMDMPAVGCAFTVEALLGWMERAGVQVAAPRRVGIDVSVGRCAALREAASVRARGQVATLEFGPPARRKR